MAVLIEGVPNSEVDLCTALRGWESSVLITEVSVIHNYNQMSSIADVRNILTINSL